MKAGLRLISTKGAHLPSLEVSLTVPYFHDTVSDTDAILGVLISNKLQNAGLVYLEVVWEVIRHIINCISMTGSGSGRLVQ